MTQEESKVWLESQREKQKSERREKIKKYWCTLELFKEPEDIPELPQVDDSEEWNNFYIPKLIALGAIPKKMLKDGHYYIGNHRRANCALWNLEKNCFEYIRYKFGHRFKDECNHFEDDDGFSLFVPIREATPFDLEKYLEGKGG